MPTFASIGLHPELRDRLVTERSEDGHRQPIETPMALLSRHPKSLKLLGRGRDGSSKTCRSISYGQANKLRSEVAQALLKDSKYMFYRDRMRRKADSIQVDDNSETDESPTCISSFSLLDMVRFQHEIATPWSITTGSLSLDKLFSFPKEYSDGIAQTTLTLESHIESSGVPSGHVTQFSGPPASGKTQLALSLVQSTTSCWYISSNPNVAMLAERLNIMLLKSNSGTLALAGTQFCVALQGTKLFLELSRIESELEDAGAEELCKPRLLVLDSISCCLSSDSDLRFVAKTLRRLAQFHNMAVVVINGSVQDRENGGLKPALGKFWSSVPDFSIWCQPSPVGGVGTGIQCRLDRHPLKQVPDSQRPQGQFWIGPGGIEGRKISR